jgi:hypothetical protein
MVSGQAKLCPAESISIVYKVGPGKGPGYFGSVHDRVKALFKESPGVGAIVVAEDDKVGVFPVP